MHSLAERIGFAAVVILTFGLAGAAMACFPHRTNQFRMRLRGQEYSPDWFIRVFGAVMGTFALLVAMLLVFVAR